MVLRCLIISLHKPILAHAEYAIIADDTNQAGERLLGYNVNEIVGSLSTEESMFIF